MSTLQRCNFATRLFIGSNPLNIRALFINKRETLITYLDLLCSRYMFASTHITMTYVSISL